MSRFTYRTPAATVATATFVGKKTLQTVSSAYNGLKKLTRSSYLITGQDPGEQNYLINWRSDYTQLIANNFQYWNAIRNYPESTGQQFINSMACELDSVYSYWRGTRRTLWLETADSSEPYILTRLSLPDHVALENQPTKNLLFNGGFDLRSPAMFNQPDGWTDRFSYTTGTISLYENDSVCSGPSVRIYAAPGQRCFIGQKLETTLGKGNSVIFSAWYKTKVNARADGVLNLPKLSMVIKVLRNDGTYDVQSKELRIGTSLRWLRDWVRLDLSDDARAFEVSFEVNNTSASPVEYFIDAAQLEIGTYPTEFRRNPLDMPEHIKVTSYYSRSVFEVESCDPPKLVTGSNIAQYYCTGHETVRRCSYPLLSEQAIRDYYVCPTSLSVSTGATGLSSISTKLQGLYANNLDYNPYEKGWLLLGTNAFSTYPWPFTIDATGTHYIADRNVAKKSIISKQLFNQEQLYETYTQTCTDAFMAGLNYSVQVEAFTFGSDKLWALCKESYTGYTQRVLKVMYPRYYGDTGSLQCVTDFALPELGTAGTVTSIGFVESDKTKLLVSMTGTIPATLSGSTLNLNYEYFWLDNSRRQVFLRDTSKDRIVTIL